MSKCDLSVEIEDADRIYGGGDTIRGIVRVAVDSDVTCKGLEVKTAWRTHGRGNVATKTSDSKVVFTGEWRAGDDHEYPFELTVGDWPPSYHGHYLNIDHYVDARAKIPWAFDPKASSAFLMQATGGPDVATVGKTGESAIGRIVGIAVAVGFLLLLLPLIGLILSSGWVGWVIAGCVGLALALALFRYALPRYRLGKVTCDLVECRLHRGDVLTGELLIQPKRPAKINGIKFEVEAKERCVSGSGSNATTHTHLFFSKRLDLETATILTPDAEHRYPISFQTPVDAPYTLKLSSNELLWTASVRVDIPKCPDWKKQYALAVLPSGNEKIAPLARATSNPVSANDATDAGGVTFAETAQHVWDVRGDDEQRDLLVDAVSGMSFDIEAIVERRVLYGGDDDPHVYENGHAVWARSRNPELPLVLYIPHDMGEEFEQIARQTWRGRGTVLGWDHQHGRLQIRVD